jgi:DNA-binding LacI/PurR family transcriptional regulator
MVSTQKEIAKKFGVSQGLVSQIISGKWPAKSELHRQILEECSKMGYTPNHAASVLRTGRRQAWGLVFPSFTFLADFNRQIVQGIWEVAQKQGYALSVTCFNKSVPDNEEYVQFLREGRFDGLFLDEDEYDRRVAYEAIREQGGRAVILNCPYPSGMADYIYTDGAGGVCQAIKHLVEVHGRRRIAFVYRATVSKLMEDRYSGYLRGLKACGIEFNEKLVYPFVQGATYEENAAIAVKQLVSSGETFDAVVCPADYIAIPVLSELQDYGIKVPGDVSVIGFDDHHLCGSIRPRLTTVHCDGVEMGRRAAKMMLEAADQPIRSEVLPASLVVRQSCGCK